MKDNQLYFFVFVFVCLTFSFFFLKTIIYFQVPDINEAINLHFICFVEKDGQLYELDGRKKSPIVHGASSPETFLEDSAKVIQQFMQRDPDNLQFTMVALSQAEE